MIENDLTKDIIRTVQHFYPYGVDEGDDRWDTSIELERQRIKLKGSGQYPPEFLNFKQDVNEKYLMLDQSRLPAFNSCYHIQSPIGGAVINFFISAIYPGYCFYVRDPNDAEKITWNTVEHEQVGFIQECVHKHFKDYSLIPFEILQNKVPNFSVQPFGLGKGKVFNFLFTYDSLSDRSLQ